MSSSTSSTITLDRSYFDTLVRKAKFNSESVTQSHRLSLDTLLIPEEEYDNLCTISRQFVNLTSNLMRGGVGEETITLLTQDDNSQPRVKPTTTVPTITAAPSAPPAADPSDGGARLAPVPTRQPQQEVQRPQHEYTTQNYTHNQGSFRRNENASADWADQDPVSDDLEFDTETGAEVYGSTPRDNNTGRGGGGGGGSGSGVNHSNAQHHSGEQDQPQAFYKPHFDKYANRTVVLNNLADGVTHLDVTQAVRGGVLLDIYLRNDRSCAVSFLNAGDAKSFYDHVRRHDLYIKNKRVELRWADRHFILPGHVANKVGIGATRNLVIKRCDPKHTADAIRDDLEHIHNLIVIKVDFLNGNCHIKTNSVHNAMFARTCMMSRLKYKGSKIDWDIDECAQPIERVQTHRARKEPQNTKKTLNPMANRFHLLNLEEDDDENVSPFATNASVDIAA